MAGGVVQGVGPEFKPQYHKTKRKESEICFTHKHPYLYTYIFNHE
jgi:hypothetical protein